MEQVEAGFFLSESDTIFYQDEYGVEYHTDPYLDPAEADAFGIRYVRCDQGIYYYQVDSVTVEEQALEQASLEEADSIEGDSCAGDLFLDEDLKDPAPLVEENREQQLYLEQEYTEEAPYQGLEQPLYQEQGHDGREDFIPSEAQTDQATMMQPTRVTKVSGIDVKEDLEEKPKSKDKRRARKSTGDLVVGSSTKEKKSRRCRTSEDLRPCHEDHESKEKRKLRSRPSGRDKEADRKGKHRGHSPKSESKHSSRSRSSRSKKTAKDTDHRKKETLPVPPPPQLKASVSQGQECHQESMKTKPPRRSLPPATLQPYVTQCLIENTKYRRGAMSLRTQSSFESQDGDSQASPPDLKRASSERNLDLVGKSEASKTKHSRSSRSASRQRGPSEEPSSRKSHGRSSGSTSRQRHPRDDSSTRTNGSRHSVEHNIESTRGRSSSGSRKTADHQQMNGSRSPSRSISPAPQTRISVPKRKGRSRSIRGLPTADSSVPGFHRQQSRSLSPEKTTDQEPLDLGYEPMDMDADCQRSSSVTRDLPQQNTRSCPQRGTMQRASSMRELGTIQERAPRRKQRSSVELPEESQRPGPHRPRSRQGASVVSSRPTRANRRNVARQHCAAAVDHYEHKKEEDMMQAQMDRIKELEDALALLEQQKSLAPTEATEDSNTEVDEGGGWSKMAADAGAAATDALRHEGEMAINAVLGATSSATHMAADATVLVGKTAVNTAVGATKMAATAGLVTTQLAAGATMLVAKTAANTTAGAVKVAVNGTIALNAKRRKSFKFNLNHMANPSA